MQYKCRDGVDDPVPGFGRDWQYLNEKGGKKKNLVQVAPEMNVEF